MDQEPYIFDPLEPYDVPENAYRTDGKDVCHWCSLRPPEWLWGPFATRTCSLCDDLIDEGRAWDVVEGAAARITVRGNWRRGLDPERFRKRETAMIERWLQIRTSRRALRPDELGRH